MSKRAQSTTMAIANTFAIGVAGGGLAVLCYTAIALAVHRWSSGWTRIVDYLVMLPRAMPGLVAGLAMLWLFLFVPPLTPIRETLASVWLAYTLVWLAFGMRLISSTLLQVGPELEEAASTMGASEGQVKRYVTVPLIRHGMLAHDARRAHAQTVQRLCAAAPRAQLAHLGVVRQDVPLVEIRPQLQQAHIVVERLAGTLDVIDHAPLTGGVDLRAPDRSRVVDA